MSVSGPFLVGIDLGTTHTVVASAPARTDGAEITLFDIPQWTGPGEWSARPLLPSVRFHPLDAAPLVGHHARQLGAQVPGRLVSSAKSWLSHPSADRLAPILPWGADDSVAKVSPVEASASYLAHVRSAWDHAHPDAPLDAQTVVLTVPASFDEAARALTLQAARLAGLPTLTLVEEPQAAFQDWLFRHRETLATALAGVRRVLVCDVGGGTTDFSLIDVGAPERPGGLPTLRRSAVGQHLMLGGDNMDLALAHLVERRLAEAAGGTVAPLSSARLSQLIGRCRVAKEQLLAADAPERVTVTLLGGGSRLIGQAQSVDLSRDAVRALLVDGFFPRVGRHETARRARGGLVEFGLPYASDAAITRQLASFLQQHLAADAPLPDAVLLNGGVFRAEALAERLLQTLADWRGGVAPRLLHHDNPDVAVARGAVAHALARQGRAPRIGGGAARSVFLLLDDAPNEDGRPVRTVCLLPRGSEPGRPLALAERTFALRLGQPVRFHLATSTTETGAPPVAGELRTLTADTLHALPPIATVIPPTEATAGRRDLPVRLEATLAEVGTLDVRCVSVDDPAQHWQLEFQLRGTTPITPAASAVQSDTRLAPRLPEAIALLDRVFGAKTQKLAPKEIKGLRLQLEHLLGHRDRWSRPLARRLFDVLWQRARGRRRSADHERLWLNLAGWCLRPGFGDPLDAWRVEQVWTIFEAGAEHRSDPQVATQWWTLWRRVAGGLPEAAQLRLLDDFGYNLQAAEHPGAPLPPKPPGLVKGGHDDMVRLGAALERIPPEHKAEVGDWLLQPFTDGATALPNTTPERDELRLWAVGRLGARQPFHGSVHGVVSAEVAARWIDTLLALDWKRRRMAAFAAAQLARMTGDRLRDLDPDRRAAVLARLASAGAAPSWSAMVREVVQLDAADEQALFGESLPVGLVLVG
ncbi:Hsp70 family protein [Sphaerotilus sp.]|uniref:Hsp70 family protein n=1 Tax=Sphaerotilus sp. TaxID=2093942 RepID=UPI002ACEBE14|nr:Hsp70 family protein [Sphaerotilus sp.]MDZ7858762.1 Hsp70 family protein [Sphaerotilus sp.]